ncbi:ATP-binding protein [Streptomyces europaeiscabiei]|uniref:ATP-binding protein n=1 Tax=Streptomyces europaeiscabiei TaxID=146819 RepID=UPI002E1895C8|nr:ATP-binding protein [Streptomyces europaeiscabiei]
MEPTDGILLDILEDWSDRWSHTALVSALAGGRTLSSALGADALDGLAEEVLDGLLVPRGAATAARQLLAEGRFDLVDLMLDGGRLPLEDARQLKSDLADARRGAAGRATRALHLLTRRAEQLDLARGWHEEDGMGDELVELATTDESAFTELLAGWETQAREAEERRGGDLRTELERSRDGEPVDPAARSLLEECLSAGEFRLARALVRSDRAQFPADSGPSGLARLPRPVQLRRYALQDVLEWYQNGELGFAELHGWLPVFEDTAGRRLTDALAALVLAGADRPPEPSSVRELVEALHECVGTAEPVVECEALAGGVVSRLYCTGDHRLPPLGLFGRAGIALWVAPSTAEPPEQLASTPFIWLAPEWEGETPSAEGCGPLYADDLLRLAAPTPRGSVPPAAERQLALLRAVAPGLGVSGLLDAGRSGAGRGLELAGRGKAALQLSWFFDLLGLQPDSVTVEAVLYETGGHPSALRELLRTLCDHPEPRLSGRDLSARLEAMREGSDWRRRAARRVQEQLPDVNAGLALHTALWLHTGGGRGEFEVGELTDVLADLAGSDGVPPLVELADGVGPLVSLGIMERRNGRLTLAPNGLPELLARGSGRQAEEMVADLLRQAREQADAVLAQVVVSLNQITVDTVDHYNTNLQRKLSEINTQMVEEEDRERRMTLNEEYLKVSEQLRQVGSLMSTAKEAPRPLSLAEIIVEQTRGAHVSSGGRDRYDVTGAEHLWVRANPWLLGQVFWNLFDNSRKAIDATAAQHGFVEMTVTAWTAVDGTPWCAILVADSGDGMAQGVASRLNQGECLSTRNGSGQGIRLARALTQLYEGRLRVLPEPSPELFGAQVRIELPLVSAAGD